MGLFWQKYVIFIIFNDSSDEINNNIKKATRELPFFYVIVQVVQNNVYRY